MEAAISETTSAPKVLMTVREAFAVACDEVKELSERSGDPAVVLSQLAVADTAVAFREALIPFVFTGRAAMERLGLAAEYDEARKLLGLPPVTE